MLPRQVLPCTPPAYEDYAGYTSTRARTSTHHPRPKSHSARAWTVLSATVSNTDGMWCSTRNHATSNAVLFGAVRQRSSAVCRSASYIDDAFVFQLRRHWSTHVCMLDELVMQRSLLLVWWCRTPLACVPIAPYSAYREWERCPYAHRAKRVQRRGGARRWVTECAAWQVVPTRSLRAPGLIAWLRVICYQWVVTWC